MDSSHGGTPLPEEASKFPEGLVLPPKDIRAIVEKTAGYVARNGAVFEDRVRDKEKNNPKFSFLNTGDAYEPFYQWRLNEIKEGRGSALTAGRPGEPVAAVEPEKPKGPPEPPAFHFSARMPPISAQDLEVVKLTALYVAKRGKSFMTALSQREARNFQFDFLRPQHSLYQFFTRLVDQYTILLRPEGIDEATTQERRISNLEHNVQNKFHIIERAKQRAEWVKFQEQQKQQKEEEEEKERIEYAQIDWHDFVVVETVLFTESDDQAELPPPTSLNDLQSASLEQKAAMSLNPLRIEEAMPTDLDQPTYYNAYPAQAEPSVPAPQPSVSPYPVQAASPYPPPAGDTGRPYPPQPDMVQARTESPTPAPGQPPMRIRSDYVPRAQARRQQASGPTALCPNCHQQIPVAELEQHMRIELLDPRWKEQRAKNESRSATTNLSTADVVNNLKRMASHRSDVFDPSLAPDPEEEARRKRVAMGNDQDGNLPPGVAPPPGTAIGPGGLPKPPNTNIEDQIRHFHQLARR
ncbi:Pre-mRNA splicing factor PRP21-like protein [Penicillium ucsense]|uniref:Pre-mRNA splicing factor PRP21-like protein n=1 Tax=Penicillium ucsense TaxID=2839758 RepID=A0A8J8WKV3_9EURO|nr:Pre-mRNA splicing factor PRP21-like protein [Penicillium ucsense]KAF7738866.1 Pre-mRNA splicing factor PRP21-like protein [Penicillium ucsense]